MATKLEQVQEQREMKYWEHDSFKGNVLPINYRYVAPNDPKRFKKAKEERALLATMKLAWQTQMKKKYGDDWRSVMKAEKLYN